jgi:hypothetical protein
VTSGARTPLGRLLSLVGLVVLSLVGCYAYCPTPREVFEEMSVLRVEVPIAALSVPALIGRPCPRGDSGSSSARLLAGFHLPGIHFKDRTKVSSDLNAECEISQGTDRSPGGAPSGRRSRIKRRRLERHVMRTNRRLLRSAKNLKKLMQIFNRHHLDRSLRSSLVRSLIAGRCSVLSSGDKGEEPWPGCVSPGALVPGARHASEHSSSRESQPRYGLRRKEIS